MQIRKNQDGFTLIELLIVIVIIAVLAAIVFVALDPATRFKDARDARRAADIVEIAQAIKVDQIDNGGSYDATITGLTSTEVYMIAGGMTTGCNTATCDATVTSANHCVNLSFLVTDGYLGSIPISPAGATAWDDGDTNGENGTGYTLSYNSTTGTVTVQACESENTTEISVSR